MVPPFIISQYCYNGLTRGSLLSRFNREFFPQLRSDISFNAFIQSIYNITSWQILLYNNFMEETKIAAFPKSLLKTEIVFWLFSFTVPFFFSNNQLLTGTIVNCLLFLACRKLTIKSTIPIIIFPSLATLAHNAVFGPITFLLLYFIPFIWIGNFILVKVFSTLKQPYLINVLIASIAKSSLLFIIANLYFKIHLVPSPFLTLMGAIQLITAIAGGVLAYIAIKTKLVS